MVKVHSMGGRVCSQPMQRLSALIRVEEKLDRHPWGVVSRHQTKGI